MKLGFMVAFFLMIGGVAWLSAHRRVGRERQLMLLCQRAGLEYMPIDPFDDLWLPFRLLGRGSERGTRNAVWDRTNGDGVRVFDLWYRDDGRGGAEWPATMQFTCAVAQLPFTCPRIAIEPRETLDILEDAIGLERFELELEAFNRRFRVATEDRRTASAFLDQRMMQALLGLPPGVTMTVNEDRLLLHAPLLPAAKVLLLLDVARSLQAHIPPVMRSLHPPRPMEAPREDRWLQGHWSAEPTGTEPAVPPGGEDG